MTSHLNLVCSNQFASKYKESLDFIADVNEIRLIVKALENLNDVKNQKSAIIAKFNNLISSHGFKKINKPNVLTKLEDSFKNNIGGMHSINNLDNDKNLQEMNNWFAGLKTVYT